MRAACSTCITNTAMRRCPGSVLSLMRVHVLNPAGDGAGWGAGPPDLRHQPELQGHERRVAARAAQLRRAPLHAAAGGAVPICRNLQRHCRPLFALNRPYAAPELAPGAAAVVHAAVRQGSAGAAPAGPRLCMLLLMGRHRAILLLTNVTAQCRSLAYTSCWSTCGLYVWKFAQQRRT
jgi:hypothetical protein